MRIEPTTLADTYLVHSEGHEDERGAFFRSYCEDAFTAAGLPTRWPQHNISYNRNSGTLRGLHIQTAPHAESKLIRCVHGKVFDVVVDLREGSGTFGDWFGVDLAADTPTAVYAPPGTAHGFLTLEDDTVLHYLMGTRYAPEAAKTLRWDDPDLAITWPTEVRHISDKDRQGVSLAQWSKSR